MKAQWNQYVEKYLANSDSDVFLLCSGPFDPFTAGISDCCCGLVEERQDRGSFACLEFYVSIHYRLDSIL